MNARNCRVILAILALLCSHMCFAQEEVDDSEVKPSPPPGDQPDNAPADSDAPVDPSENQDGVAIEKKGSSGELQADDGASDAGNAENAIEEDKPKVEQPIVLLSCYQCNTSYDGEKCMSSDAKDLRAFLKPCLDTEAYHYVRCRKSHQFIQGETRLIRSCATLGSVKQGEDTCYERSGSLKILTKTCECFNKEPHEPCNTATQKALTSLPILITSLFLALRR